MMQKTVPYTFVAAAIVLASLGGYILGTKAADLLGRRFIKPRIREINVWNGPVPTHPSSR
jgi:hypothetical protein